MNAYTPVEDESAWNADDEFMFMDLAVPLDDVRRAVCETPDTTPVYI